MRDTTAQRLPGQPLSDTASEAYARLRASGETCREAAELSGLRDHMRLEKSPDFRVRVQELRGEIEEQPKLSLQWLVGQLMKNVEGARNAEQFKASTEALKHLHDLYRDNKDHFDAEGREESGPAAVERKGALRGRLAMVQPKAAS
jgi:hypothetical protein